MLSRVWGALAILLGTSLLLLSAGAASMLVQPSAVGLAAGITAFMFAIAGVFALVWGGASVWSGVLIGRRIPLGRALGLALAVINLMVLPFGTAFGVYALWVLLANEGRRLFELPAVS